MKKVLAALTVALLAVSAGGAYAKDWSTSVLGSMGIPGMACVNAGGGGGAGTARGSGYRRCL